MKFTLILALILSTQVYAVDICSFQETWEFSDALDKAGIRPVKNSRNHKRFTFIEKEMIHLTITLQEWLGGVSREEAIEQFADISNGRRGPNAGEVVYFHMAGKHFALVHYWPGDNEYGAYYELKNSAYRLVAEINDSYIECRPLN